jgi:hypothetical protein
MSELFLSRPLGIKECVGMGDLVYLAAGHAVFWLVSFIFIYSMVSRQNSVRRELQMLEQLVQADEADELRTG